MLMPLLLIRRLRFRHCQHIYTGHKHHYTFGSLRQKPPVISPHPSSKPHCQNPARFKARPVKRPSELKIYLFIYLFFILYNEKCCFQIMSVNLLVFGVLIETTSFLLWLLLFCKYDIYRNSNIYRTFSNIFADAST